MTIVRQPILYPVQHMRQRSARAVGDRCAVRNCCRATQYGDVHRVATAARAAVRRRESDPIQSVQCVIGNSAHQQSAG